MTTHLINPPLAETDILILAGGLGTRLQDVVFDRAKILAPIAGRPFLEILLQWLVAMGARRVVLSLGYRADTVLDYLSGINLSIKIETVVESEPLGTGGAVRLARPSLKSSSVLIMNGDTWLETDLNNFILAHRSRQAKVSMLCIEAANVSRYGRLTQDEEGYIRTFQEKDSDYQGNGLVNGGVYLFCQEALDLLAEMPGVSLEQDFLQKLPTCYLYGVTAPQAKFVDIGTPESLKSAPYIITSM